MESSQTLRVALLTTSFPLKEGSASGVFVQRLVKSLPSSVAVTVITPSDTSAVNMPADTGYKLHCFRYAPWKRQTLAHQPGGIPVALKQNKVMRWLVPVFLFSMFLACFRVARKADIIHANWSINGSIAGLVGFVLRKPVVTTVRGEDVTRAKGSKIYRFILQWCLRSNKKLVAVSEAIYELLLREFPDYHHKIIFLPNGVEPNLLDCSIASSRPERKEKFCLVTVGSLIPRKGVDVIIQAIGHLQSQEHVQLVVVGEGPERKKLERLIEKLGLKDQIQFVGNVVPDKVVNYLVKADALVLASYSEGRPNVVLESMATGVPVIASDIEGVRELLQHGENGFRFQPGDAGALAALIEQLRDSYELQTQFSKNGRKFILDNELLWPNVGARYAAIYKEVMGSEDLICVD